MCGRLLDAPRLAVEQEHRHHDTVGRQVAAIAHDLVLDPEVPRVRRAGPAPRRPCDSLRAPARVEAEHLAVLGHEHPALGEAGLDGQPLVLGQHAVLAVYGYEVLGPHQSQQGQQVVLAAVAGDVDSGRARMYDVAAATVEVADQPRHRALVPGDGARGQDDGVARAHRHVAVLVHADGRERGQGLALAARDEDAAACPEAGRRGRVGSTRADVGKAQEAEVHGHAWRCPPSVAPGSPPRGRARARGRRRAGCGGSRWRSRRRAPCRACAARISRKAGSTSSSPPVVPFCSTFVESESSTRTPCVAPGGERALGPSALRARPARRS